MRALQEMFDLMWNKFRLRAHELPVGSKEQRLFDKLSGRYRPVTGDIELSRLLPTTANPESNFRDGWLYLKPPPNTEWLLPVIAARFDYRRSIPSAHLELGLFRFKADDATPVGVGYRFEAPEGPGQHSYYHAQPLAKLGSDDARSELPTWLPQSTPAMPVDAVDSVTLAMCILISIYGMDVLRDLGSLTMAYASIVKMHAYQRMPSYVRVETVPPTYHAFAGSSDDNIVSVRRTHGNLDAQPATEAEFREAQPSQRAGIWGNATP